MTVFDTKKHTNVKCKAKYRLINKYTKSLERYKKEQLRRKQILDLQDQGVANKAIAVKLGISKRTLQRILAKPRPYIERSIKHFAHYENEVLKQLSSGVSQAKDAANSPLSIKKKLELIRELDICWSKTSRVLTCRDLTITIDADAAINGKYALRFKPCLPVYMLEYGRITIELQMFGKSQRIGRIYAGEADAGQVSLETNQSLNALVEPILTRFKDVYNDAKKSIPNDEGQSV